MLHKRAVPQTFEDRSIQVNEYRAYTVGPDGHITASRAFKCADDSEAVVWAKQLIDGYDIELWSGKRFVIRLEHEEK
ncbi:hypothetical protein [Bradyrhizobium sp. JR3.5]